MKTAPVIRPRIRRDIDARALKILRELGNPEPPIDLALVRELLELDLHYFSTEEDGLFKSTVSRMKRAGKQLMRRPGLLGEAIRKFELRALYFPDEKRVLIDDSTPKPKHRWLQAHEIGHDILPWHREMMLGDDESTVSVTAHARIEAEANYAAGSLLFLGERFQEECRAIENPSMADVQRLKKAYGNTFTTTFWRVIEHAGEERPAIGLIGRHPTAAKSLSTPMFRHLIPSPDFERRFAEPDVREIEREIQDYCGWRKKGPLGKGKLELKDKDGERHEFGFETFYNGYDALTLGLWLRRLPSTVVAGW